MVRLGFVTQLRKFRGTIYTAAKSTLAICVGPINCDWQVFGR